VAWNRFGTPSSLVDPGRALATGVRGENAEAAARDWLADNSALFRLDAVGGLELVSDSKLAGGAGHAVSLRQRVGGLDAGGGGLVTIGVKREGGWTVISASGSVHGDETLAAQPSLAPEQAVQHAAANVGEQRSLAQIVPLGKAGAGGYKEFKLRGISDVQRTKAVAFPTVDRGFVPAYETIITDAEGAEPGAYRTFIDGRSGAVLARDSLVHNADDSASAQAAPVTNTFSGELPNQDGGCDTRKGPYTAGAGVRVIDVFAKADAPLQDIVLRLYRDDTLVAQQDTLLTPERILYTPATAGAYYVEVCEFDDAANTPPVEPRTYRGTITLHDSSPPAPFTARWRVFPSTPLHNQLAADPWNNPSTDVREDWCWRATTNAGDCDEIVANLASRAPWDHDVKANAPSFTTIGNNADTAESWSHPLFPSPTQYRPVTTTRDYSFRWTNSWYQADCNAGTPYGAAFVPGESFDVAAAVTNLFVQHNRMHDWSYFLGFTEENWNAQDSNFGLTAAARENDPLLGNAQAGANPPPPGVPARDNANMITQPDGVPSITNMYLWQPLAGAFYSPCVDGDYDAGVIGHEYGHMVENRMIGKGNIRTGHHAGAMGESTGDLMAIEQLNEHGHVPTDGANRWATGTYATGNKLRGIRNYAGNFPRTGAFPTLGVYAQVDPLNFWDVGYDLTGPQVHADGEIWTATNFDLRRALVEKYNGQYPESDQALQEQCAKGQVVVDRCPGNRRWIQLVLDSFLLMPTAPTMVDARNMILAADDMRFGGANQSELWLAFARRGFGRDAASSNTTGSAAGVESDQDPLPSFEAPGQPNGTVTFEALSRPGREPVDARIYVGHHEARVSPIADTDPATSAPATAPDDNLDGTALLAPGTYEFIATAPGYGAVRFRRDITANSVQRVRLLMAENVASRSQGATASGDAAPVTVGPRVVLSEATVRERLIDDTEATHWQAAASDGADGHTVDGRRVTVDPAGGDPQRINRAQVSAMLGPVFDAGPPASDLMQNRFTALRQFELWSCNARNADCSTDAGFRRIYASAGDAFPSDQPRPVSPTLLLREFSFDAVRATHLRLVTKHSQCTGGPDFQGEQDADPFNATDCNQAGAAPTRFVRAAELQAFGQESEAR
jgi:extracellular elastinolytic metalloproteinase